MNAKKAKRPFTISKETKQTKFMELKEKTEGKTG